MRPPFHWSKTHRVILAFAHSIVNSIFNTIESVFYGRKIAKTVVDEEPLFIIGHWRSGTTLLHNLISKDESYTYCNLYQVLFHGHFLTTESFVTKATAWLLPKTRPMDNMSLGWQHPQEDEMFLVQKTLISPYLMLAFQEDTSIYDDHFELTNLSEEKRAFWKQSLMTFLKKLTLKNPGKKILLKSPTHTFRIPVLLEMFPNAKFVFISREPYTVYKSGIHLRKTLFLENGFCKSTFKGLEDMTLNLYRRLFDVYERDRHLIPEGNLHELSFEDLEVDPVEELRKVYENLNLPGFDKLEQNLKAELADHHEFRKNKYEMEDEEMKRRIYEKWKPAFERFGYPSDLDLDGKPARQVV